MLSSDGSSWTLSWKPRIVPSRSTTSAEINRPAATMRSVPRTTATLPPAAAAATADQARSRNGAIRRRQAALPKSGSPGRSTPESRQIGALARGLRDGLFGQRRPTPPASPPERDVGERDSDCAHDFRGKRRRGSPTETRGSWRDDANYRAAVDVPGCRKRPCHARLLAIASTTCAGSRRPCPSRG